MQEAIRSLGSDILPMRRGCLEVVFKVVLDEKRID
jgi:hypothetical protein